MRTLPIVCCGGTQQAVKRAVKRLRKVLRPLGIEPILETREIDEKTFKANPSESNRIWIAGKPMEEWLGATAGSSRCDSVFEATFEGVFLKAAMIAAGADAVKYRAWLMRPGCR